MTGGGEGAIRFTADGLELEGRVATPAGATRGVVICHPHPQYGGDMNNNVVLAVAGALHAAGIATLRFNFRGVGASQGRYDGGQGEARDARAAVDCLRARLGNATVALAGYSFGAVVALLAGHEDAVPVSHLAAIAPPVSAIDLSILVDCSHPKLFVAGDRDPFCPLATLEHCIAGLAKPKQLVKVAGADHFFCGHEVAVAAAVARFVAQELSP